MAAPKREPSRLAHLESDVRAMHAHAFRSEDWAAAESVGVPRNLTSAHDIAEFVSAASRVPYRTLIAAMAGETAGEYVKTRIGSGEWVDEADRLLELAWRESIPDEHKARLARPKAWPGNDAESSADVEYWCEWLEPVFAVAVPFGIVNKGDAHIAHYVANQTGENIRLPLAMLSDPNSSDWAPKWETRANLDTRWFQRTARDSGGADQGMRRNAADSFVGDGECDGSAAALRDLIDGMSVPTRSKRKLTLASPFLDGVGRGRISLAKSPDGRWTTSTGIGRHPKLRNTRKSAALRSTADLRTKKEKEADSATPEAGEKAAKEARRRIADAIQKAAENGGSVLTARTAKSERYEVVRASVAIAAMALAFRQ